jgi:hypothetical protein
MPIKKITNFVFIGLSPGKKVPNLVQRAPGIIGKHLIRVLPEHTSTKWRTLFKISHALVKDVNGIQKPILKG